MVVGSPKEDLASGFVDAGAVYVFERDDNGTPHNKLDDFWQQQAKLTAPDAASNDQFGSSVSVSGNTLVVGSYLDDDGGVNSGSAYIFSRSGGTWTLQAKLIASDGAAEDQFGFSVSISDDTVIVGSHFDDDAGSESGSAYVFLRSADVWSQQSKLVAADAASDSQFGHAVSVSGDTAVAGSIVNDAAGVNSGSAYVFVRNGNAWTQQGKLVGDDTTARDQFGCSLSISEDTLIVGSRRDDDAGSDSGSAYVFSRNGSTWSQDAKLTAADAAASDWFGRSVSLFGDTAVVGNDARSAYGAAYIFSRNGGQWSQQANLGHPDGVLDDRFGFSVSISDDTVVAGSIYDDVVDEGQLRINAGSTFVFSFDGSTWFQQDQVFAFDEATPEAGANFGIAVAVDGDTMVVGSRHEDLTGGLIDAGAAFVYRRDNNGTPHNKLDDFWRQEAKLTADDAAAYDRFGRDVSISGDTIVVGSPYDDHSHNQSIGSAYIFTFAGGIWSQQAKLVADDGAAYDSFGFAVSVANDIVVVGSLNGSAGSVNSSGSAYVFERNGDNWIQQVKLCASDAAAGDQFGFKVSVSGETVVVGSYLDDVVADNGQVLEDAGSAYVFSFDGNTWFERAHLTAEDLDEGDWFGASVAIYDDTLIVGSMLDSDAGVEVGSAYVFALSGGEWSQQAKLTASDVTAVHGFGTSVSLSGDTAVVGSSEGDGADWLSGSVYIFSRSASTWSQQTKLTATDAAAGDQFGFDVAISGDTVLVGSLWDDVVDDGQILADAGSAYVFVVNNHPSITVDNALVTVDEGKLAENGGSFRDLDLSDSASITASVGTVTHDAGNSGVWNWSFPTTDGPDESQTVTITATDSNGASASTTFSLAVNNMAPTVAADQASVTVNEGQTAMNTGAFGDGGIDTVTLSASVGIATDNGDGTWSWSFNTSDGPDDSQSVTITATDSDGAWSDVTFSLAVENVAPTADDASFEVVENSANGKPVGSVTASDPGADTWTYGITGGTGASAFTIDSGTGTITVADATQLDFEATLTFTLEVTVTDDDGATDIANVTINLLNQASITGTVFVDTDLDGMYDANEMGLDGVTVELLDELGQPVFDEMGAAITATTRNRGFYLFEDLAPGTYQIHELQLTGVDDGAEQLGTIDGVIAGRVVADDTMQLTLDRLDASDYIFAEIGQQVASGDTAGIGFWQNKHGQSLIRQGGAELADWLTANFANVFGNSLQGEDGDDVASFYKDQLFKQKSNKSAGPAKVDAQFMAVALSAYFTNGALAGDSAADYGFNVTDTGIGTKTVNVGANGAAFGVADDTNLTILQLLWATDRLTDTPDSQSGFAYIYDTNGDGVIDADEARLRSMANGVYSAINEQGNI